jgi:hypothetical protein
MNKKTFRIFISRKQIIFVIISLFIGASFTPCIIGLENQQFITQEKTCLFNENLIETLKFKINFSELEILDQKESLKIKLKETKLYTQIPGLPKIPFHSKVSILPFGTKIIDVICKYSNPENIKINKKVETISIPDNYPYVNNIKNMVFINDYFEYRTGGGINNGEQVTFLLMNFYPIKYDKDENILSFVNDIEIQVKYLKPKLKINRNENYKLVILAPQQFKKPLEKLIIHKNKYGMPSKLVTLDEIYQDKYFEIDGNDNAEEIKYFISNAFKNWGTEYILIVGNINKFPIRKTWMGTGDYERTPLTDLYYADLFFGDGTFCSWDSNNNGFYGEWSHGTQDDMVDLYPDVFLGRLACNNLFEVNTVIEKIIEYEESTYEKEWHNNMILAGGDTHPSNGNFLEGEYLIDRIVDETPDFNHIILKTSNNTYSASSLNNAINEGAGFVCYAGHGFEIGLGTHPPMSEEWISYYLYDLFGLKNKNKLPVVFFSACLTARLDYNLLNVFADLLYFLSDKPRLQKPELDFPVLFPCFAWSMVSKQNGGAIAAIGATRVAYSMIGPSGIIGGCCFLALKFFESISKNDYLGEIFVSANNEYLEKAAWWDPFTVEEFVLLGDPSLKIGGYP